MSMHGKPPDDLVICKVDFSCLIKGGTLKVSQQDGHQKGGEQLCKECLRLKMHFFLSEGVGQGCMAAM